MVDDPTMDRRTFLKYAGGTTAAGAVAGCTGGDGGGTETTTGGEETTAAGNETTGGEETTAGGKPESREAVLQRVNRILHDQAPWVYLNRQFSVYGVSSDVKWQGRRDERIDGYAIQPQGENGEVTITQSQMDSGLDPHDHRETPTDNIVLQAYEGVLARDPEGKVIDQLATDYQRVEDGVVEFTIRDGVSFHEGGELTAGDVAYSINRIVKEDVGDLASPQSDQLAGVTGAEAPDDSTVRVTSDGINPIVFSLFATYCDVMQQSWVEENDSAYINSHMNGTGPFRLANYEEGVQVVYERNEDYRSDPAPAAGLTIQSAGESSTRVNQLLNGETDIAVNVPPQDVNRVRNSDTASLTAVPSTRVIFNAMRYDVEPFSSPKFRRAVNLAIDLNSIIENVLQGFAAPTGQPTLEGFTGYNSDVGPYTQDAEKAQQLVEESGHAGISITLETPVGRYLKDVEVAQAVANQIDSLSNVSCELEQREFQSLVSEITTGKIEDKPPFYLIGWGNATFDASQTIIPLLTTGGALTTYENEQVDQLMDRAQSMGGQPNGN
jgi:peptide/nickel transport system substrate-binding protein